MATTTKGHCPTCGDNRNAHVRAQFEWTNDLDDQHGIIEDYKHRILQCCGCDAVFYQRIYTFSEDIDYRQTPDGGWEQYNPETIKYFPSPLRRSLPTWLPKLAFVDHDLFTLVNDIYTALDNELNVLAAIGVRTAFDRASELLEIDSQLTFAGKLDGLQQAGTIGKDEKSTLDVLTDAGSAAAHRGWRPRPAELDTMMSVLETFLYRAFILQEEAKQLRASVPARK